MDLSVLDQDLSVRPNADEQISAYVCQGQGRSSGRRPSGSSSRGTPTSEDSSPSGSSSRGSARRARGGRIEERNSPVREAAGFCWFCYYEYHHFGTISGPGGVRADLGGFRVVRDGTSGGPPGETSKFNDTIQEHSFITSLFCLVVFGSLSVGSSS